MGDIAHHVHVGGVYAITFLATLYSVNFVVRLWTARHANNPAAQALAFAI